MLQAAPAFHAEQARSDLHTRLQARRAEIERAVLTRIYAVSDPAEVADPEYAEGLRATVTAALDYGLLGVLRGGDRALPIPAPLLAQARLAARNGISLDMVLRRYFAGQALLSDFLIEEAERNGALGRALLQRLVRAQATLFERLVTAVSDEHHRESDGRFSNERRAAERIERLLAGELLDTSQVAYDFEGHHLGAIASGADPLEGIRELANGLDCLLLSVRRGESMAWAWLGGRRPIDPLDLCRAAAALSTEVSLAIGEPAQGLAGWRLTHQQARAAMPVALRSPECVTRYSDVALLSSILRDDLLATSLRELYLAPLERERDGGEALKETLRAYFAAERNVSSTASILGVSRRTVTNRIRTIEDRLGLSLGACLPEVEAALRFHDLCQGAGGSGDAN
jgi:hypothetical protein